MKKQKLSQPTAQQKNAVYICGDSFSFPGASDDNKIHWSNKLKQQLPKILPNARLYNLSVPTCTNFTITLQIEKAITDPNTCFVIVNASELFKIIVPTKRFVKISKHFWKHKGLVDESYAGMFKEPFFQDVKANGMYVGAELLDQISMPWLHEYNQLKPYDTVGIFALYLENKVRKNPNYLFESKYQATSRYSDEMWQQVINFFEVQFDINLQWNQDFALLEGKFYKLLAKNIGFVFNLGGLVDSSMREIRPDYSDVISDELKPYQSDINLWDLPRVDLFTKPNYHNHIPQDHIMIANHYLQRIEKSLKDNA